MNSEVTLEQLRELKAAISAHSGKLVTKGNCTGFAIIAEEKRFTKLCEAYVRQLLTTPPASGEESDRGKVLVDRAVLQIAINMLQRDAELGKQARGEVVELLEEGLPFNAKFTEYDAIQSIDYSAASGEVVGVPREPTMGRGSMMDAGVAAARSHKEAKDIDPTFGMVRAIYAAMISAAPKQAMGLSETALSLLVAAGHVSQAKVDESLAIAASLPSPPEKAGG